MRKILIFSLILIFVLGIAGCGNNSDSLVANDAGELEGERIFIYTSKPDTLCPIFSKNESNLNMLDIVYDSLVRINDKLSAEPCLAESWEVSEDGRMWKLNLRKNVLWHDGSQFGASDVVYTVNKIKNSEDSIYRYHVSYISDIRANGQHSVEIQLSEQWPGFVNLLYFPIIKDVGEINVDSFNPIGTGSYKFENRNESNTYYLVRNDNWWGGKALTETITVKVLPDTDTALHSFSSGVVDIAIAEGENWNGYVTATASYTALNSTEFTFLGINNSDEVLQFAEVRDAISKAVDREAMVAEAAMGYGIPASVPFHPEWDVCAGKTFKTALNIDDAKKILKVNGWVSQGDYHTKTVEDVAYSTDFTLIYNEENEMRGFIAESIKKSLGEAGIRVTVEKLTYEDYNTRIAEGSYDLFVGSSILSPDLRLSFLIGDGNIFRFSDEKMNDAVNKAKQYGPENLKDAYDGMITKFGELNPVVGLYFTDKILVQSNKLQGTMNSSCFDVYRGIEGVKKGVAEE